MGLRTATLSLSLFHLCALQNPAMEGSVRVLPLGKMVLSKSTGRPTYPLQEMPEHGQCLLAILLLHNVLEVLNCDLLPAAPDLGAVDHTLLGQVGEEGRRVIVYDSGHRAGGDAFIFADESSHGAEGFIETLDEEKDTTV